MRIALYQPDIPQNTGTILRLAACLNVGVDVIGPTGFDFSDRSLKRAGLDYLDHVSLTRHQSWEGFLSEHHSLNPSARLVLLTTKATARHVDFSFDPRDILLFGRESSGVPQAVHDAADHQIKIPMAGELRSLNIAMSVAIALGEALRQCDGFAGGANAT